MKSPVETLVQTLFEGLDLSTLDEEEFVRVFFEVIEEGERRDLLMSGCETHDPGPMMEGYEEFIEEHGEPPCQPVVWVLKP